GHVQEHHIGMLQQLILTNLETPPVDFSQAPWSEACLVMPCHVVQQQWNDVALSKHAWCSAHVVFKCFSFDTVQGALLTLQECYTFALHGTSAQQQGRRCRGNLPDTVELCVGMKVMVTQNMETDLDITNGAHQ
ncbi:hypothetical protein EDD16DRAFT_1494490, partial [Pisolithus croceorrhizus]